MDREVLFDDRRDAGRKLARKLVPMFRGRTPVVLALPRGGVPVAYEVARALEAPLDVVVARKIGAPWQPELGVGAVATDGVAMVDWELVGSLGIARRDIESIARREAVEVQRRLERFRAGRKAPELTGRTVVLVDDGIAMGVTARTALRWTRAQSVAEAVVAAPVCAPQAAAVLRREADALVTLAEPFGFRAVGQWYWHFDQTSDDEAVELLAKAAAEYAARHASAAAHR